MANPLQTVHDAIWTLLEGSTVFAAQIKEGNSIKFTERKDVKSTVQAGDLPEVRIIPTEGEANLHRTSNSSSLTKTWEIQMSSGELMLELAYELEWAVYRQCRQWIPDLTALTWEGKEFVKIVRVEGVKTGVSQEDLNRNVDGWSSLISISVEMWFTTSDL